MTDLGVALVILLAILAGGTLGGFIADLITHDRIERAAFVAVFAWCVVRGWLGFRP